MDPYDVVGVDRDASKSQIESAYRRKARELHPDKAGSASEFHALRKAYEEIQNVDNLGQIIHRDDPLSKRIGCNFRGLVEINRRVTENETIVEKWTFHSDNTVTVEIIDRISS